MNRTASIVLGLVAGLLVLVLVAEVVSRLLFPWDLLIRFESGFMTDMLKLHNGRPLFSNPRDLNTSVYAPAQEVLTYALLRPFGRALDVRFCRLVAVAFGFATAVAAAWLSARGPGRWLAFATASLLVFRNFTADAPHPDHLHALHAIAVLVACERAAARGHLGWALAAMLIAAVGVFVKIEATLAPVGAALALLATRRWRASQVLAFLFAGAAAWAATLGVLFASPNARSFVLDVLLTRPVEPLRLASSLSLVARGHLLVLAVLALPCLLQVRSRGGTADRRFLVAWAWVGAAEVLPSLAAYLWQLSDVNAFAILALWLFLIVWPCLAGRWADERWGAGAVGAVAILLIVLVPVRMPPPEAAYEYGEALDEGIARHVRAGERVALAHGTMPLVRAGLTAVPLDRGDALGMSAVLFRQPRDFEGRLAGGYYARVYANSPGYERVVKRSGRYRQIGVLVSRPRLLPVALSTAQISLLGASDLAFGFEPAMYDVMIFEPSP